VLNEIGIKMASLVMLTMTCLLVGAALGGNFKFLVLLPATVLILLVNCVILIEQGYSLWSMALPLIINASSLQAGYFAGAMVQLSRQSPVRKRHLLKGRSSDASSSRGHEIRSIEAIGE
jgi:hypothetical protein